MVVLLNDVEFRPVIVTSLIREFILPKNPLYDPELELLRKHHHIDVNDHNG